MSASKHLAPPCLAAALLCGPVLADGCPAAPDHGAELDALLAQVQAATSDMEARLISNQMWDLWDNAPDEPSQSMLDEGMRARASYDFQRAFVNFLREDFEAALPDLTQALALNPRHVGALAGQVVTFYALGRHAEALEALDKAVALNPWLTERHLRPVLEEALKDL